MYLLSQQYDGWSWVLLTALSSRVNNKFVGWTICGLIINESKSDYQHPNIQVISVMSSKCSRTVDFIMTNISNRITNEKFFPTKTNSPFPSNFHQSIIKPIHKQMFRIFAHVYWAHFEVLITYSGFNRARLLFISD